MRLQPIPYLSTQAAADLWTLREENISRYIEGDFQDQLTTPGSAMELPILGDLDSLNSLDATKAEYDNALIVWKALINLTPSLARENRIWTRLCHGEGLSYARKRWLDGKARETLVSQAGIHFFARTHTMCRDDNALGRLWWTAFAANRAAPEAMEQALALLLKTTDIRSNFIERTWMTTRPTVSGALVRAMMSDPWITSAERNFRETMKALNIEGAGVAFEVLSSSEGDRIIRRAVERAKVDLDKPMPTPSQELSTA